MLGLVSACRRDPHILWNIIWGLIPEVLCQQIHHSCDNKVFIFQTTAFSTALILLKRFVTQDTTVCLSRVPYHAPTWLGMVRSQVFHVGSKALVQPQVVPPAQRNQVTEPLENHTECHVMIRFFYNCKIIIIIIIIIIIMHIIINNQCKFKIAWK